MNVLLSISIFVTNIIFIVTTTTTAVHATITTPSSRTAFLSSPTRITYPRSSNDLKERRHFRRSAFQPLGSSVGGETHQDDEWHPHDPASSTPQLLAGVWDMIAHGGTLVKGETYTVIFPEMEQELNNPKFLNVFTAHLDSCKDVCDHFGITTTLLPYTKKNRIIGFTVKSYRNPDKDLDSEYEFDYDPFWDDGLDIPDYEKLLKEQDELEASEAGTNVAQKKSPEEDYPEIANKIPNDDDEIIEITKVWVNKMMSDMGICPFTSGPEMAGLPIGPVHYCVDRCTNVEDMYARYWKEVCRVEKVEEKKLSTTLLIAPEFYIDNVELFENWSTTLTQPLAALGIENLLQLVFFHPEWSFRDGEARGTSGSSANYARRSPWPMINLLRTKQVRAAQKGIPTGLVYKQNEKTLGSIGVNKLETMLRLRNWDEVAEVKVNRREIDALRVARDFQETGFVKEEDQSLTHDATPAVNKVKNESIEQGNLIKVISDALEKRLGISSATRQVTRLSGPETSATIMASDFVLKELNRIIDDGEALEANKERILAANTVLSGSREE